MKTLVFHVQDMEWVKHPTFPGVYVKDMLAGEHGMGITNKYIKIEPQGEIQTHTHDVTEAFFILQGKASVLVNGERVELSAGNMIAAPAGQVHGLINQGAEDVILLANFGVKIE